MKRFQRLVSFCCLFLLVSSFAFLMSAESTVVGDIDGDGDVDRYDALLVCDYVSGYGFLSYEQLDLADIDGDGRVTIGDVALILHKAEGRLDTLPFVPYEKGCFTLFSLPEKTEYSEGEAFDENGLSVGMRYYNGDTVVFDDYACYGYDPTPGVKVITVEKDGFKASFTAVVYPVQPERLVIASAPLKTEYSAGEELDLTGLSVDAVMSDGSSRTIDDYTVDGFESEPGTYEITIKYRMKTVSFNVTVN